MVAILRLFLAVCCVAATNVRALEQTLLELVLPGQENHGGLTKHCFVEPNTVDDDNLGTFVNTDRCCMNHNKCSRLGPNELYDCDCEETFRQCLRANKPSIGESIFRTKFGKNYFNIVYPKCAGRGGSFTCVAKIANDDGGQRCGSYNITPGDDILTLDNKFYQTA